MSENIGGMFLLVLDRINFAIYYMRFPTNNCDTSNALKSLAAMKIFYCASTLASAMD